eukprot:COSAG06_NODE_48695_length_330_cov_0.887446_1_plen_64_part_10
MRGFRKFPIEGFQKFPSERFQKSPSEVPKKKEQCDHTNFGTTSHNRRPSQPMAATTENLFGAET